MKFPRFKLTAIATGFALISVGLMGGPAAAGAATVPSDAVDEAVVQDAPQVDLSEIPDDSVEALSCYGGAHQFGRGTNTNYVPSGWPSGAWFTTRGNCNDINLILNYPAAQSVRICFNPRSGSPYCQSSYTTISQSQWTVVATGVAPGTSYKINFLTGGEAVGRVAS